MLPMLVCWDTSCWFRLAEPIWHYCLCRHFRLVWLVISGSGERICGVLVGTNRFRIENRAYGRVNLMAIQCGIL